MEGVTTDDNGRVTQLNLSWNQLSGEIPPELDNLANLDGDEPQTSNHLSGEMRAKQFVGNLARLDMGSSDLN